MRLEAFPPLLGVVFGLIGLALLLDAWMPDDGMVPRERRRRPRRDRDRAGEALVGLGAITVAATLLSSDTWRYSVLAVMAGVVLLLWGVKRNGHYLRGVFTRSSGTKPRIIGVRRIR